MDLEMVKKIVNEYFKDTSRSQEETLSGLEELKEEIDILIDSM